MQDLTLFWEIDLGEHSSGDTLMARSIGTSVEALIDNAFIERIDSMGEVISSTRLCLVEDNIQQKIISNLKDAIKKVYLEGELL